MKPLDQVIKMQMQYVGVESFSLTDVGNMFTRTFSPGMYARLSTRLSTIFKGKANTLNFAQTRVSDKKVLQWLTAMTYIDARPMTVYVPKGMDAPILTYLHALTEASMVMSRIVPDLLAPATNLMAIILSNPSMITQQTGVTTSMTEAPLLKVKTEEFTTRVADCFNKKINTDEMTYGAAYQRHADYKDSFIKLLELQDSVNAVSAHDVEKAIAALLEKSKELAIAVKNDPEFQDITPAVANQISNLLYHCACWVEWYAVHRQQVLIISQAIADTEAKFKKFS